MRCDGEIVHDHGACTHERNCGAAAKKCADEIGIDDSPKFIGGKPVNIREGMGGSGVIYQEVKRLKALADRLKQLIYLIGIGNITALRRERQVFILELRDSRFERSGIAPCDRHSTTARRKFMGNPQTDTTASARNDCRFSREIAVHGRDKYFTTGQSLKVVIPNRRFMTVNP